jgi:hypothetical protein
MIITKLQGGLANQLFQWAHARSLSIDLNTEFYLDLSFYQHTLPGVTPRRYQLDSFPNMKASTLYLDQNTIHQRVTDDFKFKDLSKINMNHYLDGYWQSEKYFKHNRESILNDLKPSDELMDKLLKTPFIDTNVVSMHIRRTDYVTSNGFHPVQSIEYYQRALDIIGDYDYIFVFSDDINWCRENLNFKNIIFMEGFSDIEDLYLMSLCKNNIIANSSFSWWGAWLNKNPNKKVIAPLNWFGSQSNLDTSDIIPDNWIKI